MYVKYAVGYMIPLKTTMFPSRNFLMIGRVQSVEWVKINLKKLNRKKGDENGT